MRWFKARYAQDSYVTQAAVALAFDAFFTEVGKQIAEGRLPYYSGEHTIRTVWGIEPGEPVEGCDNCCASTPWIEQSGEPCRRFHPRQP